MVFAVWENDNGPDTNSRTSTDTWFAANFDNNYGNWWQYRYGCSSAPNGGSFDSQPAPMGTPSTGGTWRGGYSLSSGSCSTLTVGSSTRIFGVQVAFPSTGSATFYVKTVDLYFGGTVYSIPFA